MALACIVDGQPSAKERRDGYGTTLIVAPKAVIKQWQDECKTHCQPKWIGKVMIYRRGQFAKEEPATVVKLLQMHDVVITTYHDLYCSYPRLQYPEEFEGNAEAQRRWWKKELFRVAGPLYQVHYHRVIFDECQNIKNAEGKRFEAAKAIRASRRWLMSGSLVTDRPLEIYAYYRLINKAYTGDFETFKGNFLDKRARNAEERLKYSMTNFLLRRTHEDRINGQPLMNMPPAQHVTIFCSFTPYERALYNAVIDKFEILIHKARSEGKSERKYCLWMVTMLQMVTSNPVLMQEEFFQLPRSAITRLEHLYNEGRRHDMKEEQRLLQARYEFDAASGIGRGYGAFPPWTKYQDALEKSQKNAQQVTSKPCDGCGDSPATSQCLPCKHIVCAQCARDVEENLKADMLGNCSSCANDVSGIVSIPDADDTDDSNDDNGSTPGRTPLLQRTRKSKPSPWWPTLPGVPMPSSKGLAVKLKVLEWLHVDPTVKIVIFTQYLGMLEHLKKVCDLEKWGYVELRGSTTAKARERVFKQLSDDPSVNILLATVQTGGTGLNLQCATKMIIVEAWWNDSRDQQAFSRMWRDGQKKAVEFVRLLVKGSIDDRKVQLCNEKSEAIANMTMKAVLDLGSDKLIRAFRPADTEWEVKQGVFKVGHGDLAPDDTEDEDDDDIKTETTSSGEPDVDPELLAQARGRSSR